MTPVDPEALVNRLEPLLDAHPEIEEPCALHDVARLVAMAGHEEALLRAARVALGAAGDLVTTSPPPAGTSTTTCSPEVLESVGEGDLCSDPARPAPIPRRVRVALTEAREALERTRRALCRGVVESGLEFGDPEAHAVEGLDSLELLHQEPEALASAIDGGEPG